MGTGRVALPLAERGVPVHGIDLSEATVARLREKPGADAVGVTVGDFATTTIGGAFTLVYLVFPGSGSASSPGRTTGGASTSTTSRHRGSCPTISGCRTGASSACLPFRYVWPAELDLMGELAGLTLESRCADWAGSPFTEAAPSHVSVYRRGSAGQGPLAPLLS